MSAAQGSRPGRTRATDARIEAAVLRLLREGGAEAVTMESVAAAAPVSKVTLYARYPDRQALLEGVVERISGPDLHGAVAHPLTCKADLEASLSALHAAFTAYAGPRFVSRLLTGDEAFLRMWRERLVTPGIDALCDHFQQAARAGYVRDDVDYAALVEMILGSMALSGALQPIHDAPWAVRMAAVIWNLVAPRTTS